MKRRKRKPRKSPKRKRSRKAAEKEGVAEPERNCDTCFWIKYYLVSVETSNGSCGTRSNTMS